MEPVIEPVFAPVALGEGPHWDHEKQVLYFVSIVDGTVNQYDPKTKVCTQAKVGFTSHFILPVEGKPDHFVVSKGNKVLMIHWTGAADAVKVINEVCEVDSHLQGVLLNDVKADPRGRLFSGTIVSADKGLENIKPEGNVFRFERDGTPVKVGGGVRLANGLAWDLKDKAFYYIDTMELAVRRYDYDIETGDVSNPRHVFNFKEQGVEGYPDGMTIDTDGNLWIACFQGHTITQANPKTGKVIRQTKMPTPKVTSCTFGGPNLDQLYVTTGDLNHLGSGPEPGPPGGTTYKVTNLGVQGYPNLPFKIE